MTTFADSLATEYSALDAQALGGSRWITSLGGIENREACVASAGCLYLLSGPSPPTGQYIYIQDGDRVVTREVPTPATTQQLVQSSLPPERKSVQYLTRHSVSLLSRT